MWNWPTARGLCSEQSGHPAENCIGTITWGMLALTTRWGSQIVIQQPVKNARSRYGRLGVIVGSMLIRRHGSRARPRSGEAWKIHARTGEPCKPSALCATAGEIDAQARQTPQQRRHVAIDQTELFAHEIGHLAEDGAMASRLSRSSARPASVSVPAMILSAREYQSSSMRCIIKRLLPRAPDKPASGADAGNARPDTP